jgi:hypothetical protein
MAVRVTLLTAKDGQRVLCTRRVLANLGLGHDSTPWMWWVHGCGGRVAFIWPIAR